MTRTSDNEKKFVSYADRARALVETALPLTNERIALDIVDKIMEMAEAGHKYYDVPPDIPVAVQSILMSRLYGFKIKDRTVQAPHSNVCGYLRIMW